MPLAPEQRDWLTLVLVPGVGTTYFIKLLARFRTPGRVLQASEAALADVVGAKLAQRIRQYEAVVDVAAQERALAAYDAHVLTMDDPAYPPRLAEIYDPPLLLFVRGTVMERDEHAVALVGTRKASPYGLRMARRFGYDLARRGITVISGMANGVDAAAHEGALEAGGRTIAVLGCGADVVYPKENAELMQRIIAQGAVVTCFAMGVKPARGHFPFRNRIISGMALATCIVEAPLRSGALITARQAAEQGREVFAVPGQVGHENCKGPHALIQEGAKLVQSAEDMLVELEVPAALRAAAVAMPAHATHRAPAAPSAQPDERPAPRFRQATPSGADTPATPRPAAPAAAPPPSSTAPSPPQPAARAVPPAVNLSTTEKDVLAALSPKGSFVDEIAQATRLSVAEALSTLTMLELKGQVRQYSGKRFAPR